MNTWNDLSLSEKSEMMRVAIENGITTLPEIKEAYNQFALGGFEDNKPKFQKSSEAYYDPDSDTVFAPDSTGEYYYHELFHARPDSTYLQKIAPLYSDLNDEKLTQMGADLPFVKRFEGDPGHFYSPEEVGARRAAASYMLKQAGVKSIDDTFLNEARKDELKYGNNFRDLLHMYNNENLLQLDLLGNQFAEGGKIHIKPENRGKFTALKERTGHSATWFKQHGTPAQKKMATFALNAKKWKHALGGNIFSGEDTPTQQMNNGLNLYRRTNNLGETEYIYQETPDSEEILLTPTNKRFSDDPTNWDYKDANGREYTPSMVKPAVAQAELRPYEKDWYHKMTEALGYDWLVNKSNEYYNNPILGAAARWAASYDNNTNPIKGLWNSSLAYGNVYSMAAKAADELLLNPNGLQKTIDLYNSSSGSHADRYAWQSSLLGDVFNASMMLPAASKAAKSMYNGATRAVENYRYPLGRPQVPEGYITIKPQVRTRVGDIEIDNPQLAYRQGEGIVDDFIKRGTVEAAAPPESNIVTTRGGLTFDFTPQRFDLPMFSQGRPWFGVGKKPKSKEMLVTAESLSKSNANGGLEPWEYNGTFDIRYDLGKPHSPGWLRRVPDYEQTLNTSNTSAYIWEPGYGYRRVFAEETPIADWPVSRTASQITAENAVNITPGQWTAAQDAAIARGDMTEAQRLRDLHFQVSAPNTVASVNGQPLQLYHGTDATFNAFDISKYGNTDGGTFGRGIYTTPVKTYAELYGENNMPLYMKLDNPRDYRNSSIGDLIAEKFAFGDDFATGNGIDGVIGRPSWKGFKGLEEYVSHNPKNIKSSLPITYDDNGVRIPLGERDNFNINDIRYFKDDFGKEVLITSYPGTDTQLVNAANEGHLAALRHQFSQDKTEQLKSVMGWDDAAIAEYQDEILRSSGSPADIQVRGTDTGFKEIGNHAGNISQNGESVSHSMTLNRDRIPDDATAIEAGIHEMGVHGRTLSIDPSEIGVEGSYSNTIAQKFPRIAEVMKKNQEIAKQTLIPNDRGKLFQQIKKSSDLERWLYENNVPVEQWEEYFNDWKYYKYVTEDQELLARGYTGQVYETVDPSRETLNIQQLKKFFTPESTEKYKKAVLSTLPFLFTGYGLSQGNE